MFKCSILGGSSRTTKKCKIIYKKYNKLSFKLSHIETTISDRRRGVTEKTIKKIGKKMFKIFLYKKFLIKRNKIINYYAYA